MKKHIAQVVVDLPVEGPFSYRIPPALLNRVKVGQRVWIPFGRKRKVGYIVRLVSRSSRKNLKDIYELIDETPLLDKRILSFAKLFSGHFACTLGAAIATLLPSFLRQGKKMPVDNNKKVFRVNNNLRNRQKSSWMLICQNPTQIASPIVIEKLQNLKKRKEGAIILVPEMALMEPIKAFLEKSGITDIFSIDKRLSPKEEARLWLRCRQGEPLFIMGMRSVVFWPVANLRLIVMFDEESEAYKQEQTPYYHTRRVIELRSQNEGIDVICLSVAPSVELWGIAKKKRYPIIVEEEQASPPVVRLIDMSTYQKRRVPLFSFPLHEEIQKVVSSNEQMILYMNRKGFSTVTLCRECGFVLKCERCDTPMTYLFEQKAMICRYCQNRKSPPDLCPQCRNAYLQYRGRGVEKLESNLSREFPQAKIAHYDKDSAAITQDFHLLITTQAILRWRYNCRVSSVGIIQLDNELNRPDFRCTHKAIALFMHLKALATKNVFIQTLLPDNYCVKAMAKGKLIDFYRKELKFRRELGLPPYKNLIAVMARGKKQAAVIEEANVLFEKIKKEIGVEKDTEIVSPQADIPPKLRGNYRFYILIKTKKISASIKKIRRALSLMKRKSGVIITINVDP